MLPTFLAYVATKLLGEPTSSGCWPCPVCDHRDSLAVNDPKPGCAIKWRCFRCMKWGDEFDLLVWMSPGLSYGDRKYMIGQFREEYHELLAKGGRGNAADAVIPSPGRKNTYAPRRSSRINFSQAELDWSDWLADIDAAGVDREFAYRVITEFYERGWFGAASWRVGRMLQEWQRFNEWVTDTDEQHMACCTDADCDWSVCRAQRGLPRMTREEIARDRLEQQELQRQREEEYRQAVERARAKLKLAGLLKRDGQD